jgi:hypothetical protein
MWTRMSYAAHGALFQEIPSSMTRLSRCCASGLIYVQMKGVLMKHLFAVFALFAASSPALAHAGDHHHFDLWAALSHLATQPFHIVMIAGAVGTGIFLAARYRRSKAVKVDLKDKR